MTIDAFEAELRQALARRAAEVPAAASERLQQRNYRPRAHSRTLVASAVLAVAVLAAGGSAYLTAATGGPSHPAGTIITLDGYQFSLPAGFAATRSSCTAPARGGLKPSAPAPGTFTAAAAAHGGCLEAVFSTANLTPPRWAAPVRVGRHNGFVAGQPAEHRIALYVNVAATSRYHWLVITARNLSQTQVATIASRALS